MNVFEEDIRRPSGGTLLVAPSTVGRVLDWRRTKTDRLGIDDHGGCGDWRGNVVDGRDRPWSRQPNLISGLLFGVGLAAFIDETVFHQLLHWHHFYDRSTTNAGLVSDGLFHAFGWFATVAALFLLADVRRRRQFDSGRWFGGLLVGAGAFQLYDGIIQHKLFRLHQIRYDVELTPYDSGWNAAAVVLLGAGISLTIQTRSNDTAQRLTDR